MRIETLYTNALNSKIYSKPTHRNIIMKIRSSCIFSALIAITFCNPIHTTDLTRFKEQAALFSGNANPELAQKVADCLGIPLGLAEVKRFNDGEISIDRKSTRLNS